MIFSLSFQFLFSYFQKMSCTNTDLVIAALCLFVSEALPFASKYFPGRLQGASGILHTVFIILYRSGCFTSDQTRLIEKAIQKDLDGDGFIGTPKNQNTEKFILSDSDQKERK